MRFRKNKKVYIEAGDVFKMGNVGEYILITDKSGDNDDDSIAYKIFSNKNKAVVNIPRAHSLSFIGQSWRISNHLFKERQKDGYFKRAKT